MQHETELLNWFEITIKSNVTFFWFIHLFKHNKGFGGVWKEGLTCMLRFDPDIQNTELHV